MYVCMYVSIRHSPTFTWLSRHSHTIRVRHLHALVYGCLSATRLPTALPGSCDAGRCPTGPPGVVCAGARGGTSRCVWLLRTHITRRARRFIRTPPALLSLALLTRVRGRALSRALTLCALGIAAARTLPLSVPPLSPSRAVVDIHAVVVASLVGRPAARRCPRGPRPCRARRCRACGRVGRTRFVSCACVA